jgi:broad specificity phosphatase PhoE
MNLFLLRHFESEKNVVDALSSSDDNEKLTLKGRESCSVFATEYKAFCENHGIKLNIIHCTESSRAIETAQIIAGTINIPIKSYKSFKSTRAGDFMGKSMEEVKKTDPFFSHSFYLYGKGLLNRYFFDKYCNASNIETKKDFELRVISQFLNIIHSRDEDILIVGHKASITAMLIYIARKIGIYLDEFYGNVMLELGKISWLQYNDNNWNFKYINEDIGAIYNG